jgi:hypothetical protein
MYCQVLSQKDLDTAGVLTLHLDLLAKACKELTPEKVKADFAELESAEFLFVDYDSDEILVRSYVRRVSATSRKNNAWKSVPKNARMLASEKLRHQLANELRRLEWPEAAALADEIDPLPTPLEPPPNPLGSGLKNGRGSEGGPNPHSQVPVESRKSPSVVGSVGVSARPKCSKHETDTDENCRACMRRRLWDEQHASEIATGELEERRRRKQIATNCPSCDDAGWVLNTDPAVKCDHKVPAHVQS